MTKLIIIALLVLAAVVLVVWALILKGKEDILARKEVAMEERCDKLLNQINLVNGDNDELVSKLTELTHKLDNAVEITASYTVTESDELKYSSEEFVRKAAVKSMRFAIANDISSKFEPSVERVQGGRLKYVYKFKVVQI